jgi:hypothetical protein
MIEETSQLLLIELRLLRRILELHLLIRSPSVDVTLADRAYTIEYSAAQSRRRRCFNTYDEAQHVATWG